MTDGPKPDEPGNMPGPERAVKPPRHRRRRAGTFSRLGGIETPDPLLPRTHVSVRITAIQPQRRHPDRVNLFLDGEFCCGLAAEIVLAEGLRVGGELSRSQLDSLLERDLRWKARDAALNLLSYRQRTAAELRSRLLRKEFPEPIVESCVNDLVERGFVDDAEFARAFVRDRIRGRPRGARRLVQELRAKGVDPETARLSVEETMRESGASELELARELARKWERTSGMRREAQGGWEDRELREKFRRRLYGYLSRRGFPADVVRTVIDELFDSSAD